MGDEVQQIVIAGLDPAIHRAKRVSALMDARVKPAHDDLGMRQPS
jgi:hypothetical protein